MAFYLKPRGRTTGCCPCSQWSNCECGGAGCAIECRSKADNAELCGYEEFGTPSVPAKKFRKKTIAGTMYSGEWSVAGCPSSDGDPIVYNGSFTGGPDFWGDSSGAGSIEPIEIDAVNNRVKYRCTSLSFSPPSDLTTWGNLTAVKVIATPVAGLTVEFTTVGQEEWLSRGAGANPYTVIIAGNWTLAGYIGHTDTDQLVDVARAIDRSVRDEWDLINEFANEPGCAPVEDDQSARYVKEFGNYRLTTGGDLEEWAGFGSDPLDAYGALAEITEQTSTVRVTSGKGNCQGASAPFAKAEEDVTETLEIEDTEEDAYNRSAAGLSWNTVGPCSSHTTYITERGEILGPFGFGYRIAQVRAALSNLTNGTSYTVTFRIARRAFDSTSPWTAYVDLTVEFIAGATSGYTEWQDVPVARGYETRVMSCTCLSNA